MSRKVIEFHKNQKIIGSSAVVGKMESKGPLKSYFDACSEDSKFNMDTWEKAEAEMVRECTEIAIKKSKLKFEDVDLSFAGDLTNQCAASAFGMKDKCIPYIGLYGACSTFALSIGMASLAIEAGLCKNALAEASSHFCSAERQYRFPLEYGCQRPPTAQNTVTGSGAVIISENSEKLPCIKEFLPGVICDLGINDALSFSSTASSTWPSTRGSRSISPMPRARRKKASG